MTNCYAMEDWKARSKYMIMVPYAQIVDMQTGVNVAAKNSGKQRALYLKNCSVALVSAKRCNPDADVALVTNIEVPQPYVGILADAGVVVIRLDFDRFNFGKNYTWGLAFYKLCAQYHMSRQAEYEAIACLDSDTCSQAHYAPVWEAARSGPVFYRLGTGRADAAGSRIYGEAAAFRGADEDFTHYGGEFFVASSAQMRQITQREAEIFEKMMETGFRVSTGDEFISSMVANEMQDRIQPANDYVFRFWTGAFRSISPAYETTLVCLHVPAEKSTGMIRMFDGYVCKGKMPAREKVWRILHIPRRSMKESAKAIAKKLIKGK